MTGLRIVIVGLAVAEAGWMAFDGLRALVVGDYVAPGGRLGPWTKPVEALGIDPRSTGMKASFALYGLAWLALCAAFALGIPGTRAAMFVAAAGALWYLPVGTALSAIQMALLAWAMASGG